MSLTNYYTLGITPVQTSNSPIVNSSNNVSAVAASSTIITNPDSTTKLANTPTTSTTTNSVTVTPSGSQTQTVPIITSVSLTPTNQVHPVDSTIVVPTTTNQIHPVDSTITVPMTPVTVTQVGPSPYVAISSSFTSCIPSETTYSSKSGTLDVLFPVYLNASYNDSNAHSDTETEESDWICVIS